MEVLIRERDATVRRHHTRHLLRLHHSGPDQVLDGFDATIDVEPGTVGKVRAESRDTRRILTVAGYADRASLLPQKDPSSLCDEITGLDRTRRLGRVRGYRGRIHIR